MRGFSGWEGGGVILRGDPDLDRPLGASAAGGLSSATCRADRGQEIGDRGKMLTKIKRIKLGKQIYRRLMKRVLERDGW